MMQIQEIANGVRFENSESVKQALEKMHHVPGHELHYYLVCRDTLQATALETRQIIALAQAESDRRSARQTRCLAIITTMLSGVVGLVGVLLGVYLKS